MHVIQIWIFLLSTGIVIFIYFFFIAGLEDQARVKLLLDVRFLQTNATNHSLFFVLMVSNV